MVVNVVVNYVAVVAAAVAAMVVGFVWYSPPLFGKMWMEGNGFKTEDMEKMKSKMAKSYLFMFVACLITAYVLAYFFGILQVTGKMMALQTAGWLWLGFMATIEFANHLFGGKSFKLFLIGVFHHLVALAVMAVVLVSL